MSYSNQDLEAIGLLTSHIAHANFSDYTIVRRGGEVAVFNASKIMLAIAKAYVATHGTNSLTGTAAREQITKITNAALDSIKQSQPTGGSISLESIQDKVEIAIMRNGEYDVARAYIIHREERRKLRELEDSVANKQVNFNFVDKDGITKPLDIVKIFKLITDASVGLSDVDPKRVLDEALKNLYNGVPHTEITKSLILSARSMIEVEPNYNFVTARILLQDIYSEVLNQDVTFSDAAKSYPSYFIDYIAKGIKAELLNPKLAEYDLELLGSVLDASRDFQFKYLGLQTLYDRYFLHIRGTRIELPQSFYMRVAMGLALNEDDKNARAIEFYKLLSSFDFMSSTPTLFNSGTMHSQLSSCYLTTVDDDLAGIYDAIKDNALLSKYAGGLGNDWTSVRAMGALIKGTNGNSQGVIPFLKVVNDTAVAVNQGGKRKGAACVYLETWHADIEEFLELRKNTGDDRRRCHDINSANWIPDLFMKRVYEQGEWSLFSPNEVPELHDLYGKAFEVKYAEYEKLGEEGKLSVYKKIPALQLWRKILTMLFETGHPWITFKDPCNIRSPQQHVGVVHSSNLCTEITLNTNKDEIAVCNLGSVNLVNHMTSTGLDSAKLARTIKTAMRMLDNVIDINFYPVTKAETSNLRHRPVGMGLMGFQDCLYKLGISYASEAAVKFADISTEMFAYYAYSASSDLAAERGTYASYDGSLWSKGILPLDSLAMLKQTRGGYFDVDSSATLDWEALRSKIKQQGMRNSNCLAIAPTATISNIIGVAASTEPTFQNIFVKSNLSGEFTVVNEFLVEDLKKRGLWDEIMLSDIKYFDGSITNIERIPADLRSLYATAFEMDPRWLVEAGSRRQKWLDQAQSLNLYVSQPSGKKLDELYRLAWIKGLKTTYYLRTLSASNAEKSTGRGGELNSVSSVVPEYVAPVSEVATDAKFCSIDNPECESCQ